MDVQSTQQEAEQASVVEKTTTESQSAEQTGQAGAEQEKTAVQPQNEAKPAEQPAAQQEQRPISRRSAQYRIQQLARENAELKQQKTTQTDDGDGQPAAEHTPDIAALVQKEVERRLNPFMSESSKSADEAELGELFTGDKASERTKYEGKIRELWNLPQYKDVAAADLYKIAAFDDAVKVATERAIEQYKQAEREAKDNSASGHSNTSNRTGKGGKSVLDMTPEELQAHNDRIKAGQQP